MKRQYIIPSTITESFRTAHLCDTMVASVKGEFGFGGPGGQQTPIEPM